MAHWRGDGSKVLSEAIREKDPGKKLAKLEDALLLHFRELDYVMEHLGPENFGEDGLKRMREEQV